MEPRDQARKTVAVAMSGGVDSSVAAALLVEQGFRVLGITLQLHPCSADLAARSCCGVDAVAQARAAAGILGIPHQVLRCEEAFLEQVLRPCWEDYAAGRTPSPCLLCNARVKFGLLREHARALGADRIATGHYARVEPGGILRRALDRAKDQSYFLASLSPEQLAGTLLPLGERTKVQVREQARGLGLPNWDRVESQDACLVAPGEAFPEMLRRRFDASPRPGPVLDREGRPRGAHAGIHLFTVGQRKGLGIAVGRRAWVRRIDPAAAAVQLTDREDDLLSPGLEAEAVRWLPAGPDRWPLRCQVQVRSRHEAADAWVEPLAPDAIRVRFDAAVRAITPGQAAVLYDGDRVLGMGWIRGSV